MMKRFLFAILSLLFASAAAQASNIFTMDLSAFDGPTVYGDDQGQTQSFQIFAPEGTVKISWHNISMPDEGGGVLYGPGAIVGMSQAIGAVAIQSTKGNLDLDFSGMNDGQGVDGLIFDLAIFTHSEAIDAFSFPPLLMFGTTSDENTFDGTQYLQQTSKTTSGDLTMTLGRFSYLSGPAIVDLQLFIVDTNPDNLVDQSDVGFALGTNVPEPSAAWLLGGSFLAFGYLLRRRSAKPE